MFTIHIYIKLISQIYVNQPANYTKDLGKNCEIMKYLWIVSGVLGNMCIHIGSMYIVRLEMFTNKNVCQWSICFDLFNLPGIICIHIHCIYTGYTYNYIHLCIYVYIYI